MGGAVHLLWKKMIRPAKLVLAVLILREHGSACGVGDLLAMLIASASRQMIYEFLIDYYGVWRMMPP